LNIYKSQHS